MSQRRSRRSKRRSSKSPMPMSGAGLMRFFEDSSIGIKVGPIASIAFAIILIVVVILAHVGIFGWLF